jgi:hypothetical protein
MFKIASAGKLLKEFPLPPLNFGILETYKMSCLKYVDITR